VEWSLVSIVCDRDSRDGKIYGFWISGSGSGDFLFQRF
jgi:hypothetical protein